MSADASIPAATLDTLEEIAEAFPGLVQRVIAAERKAADAERGLFELRFDAAVARGTAREVERPLWRRAYADDRDAVLDMLRHKFEPAA